MSVKKRRSRNFAVGPCMKLFNQDVFLRYTEIASLEKRPLLWDPDFVTELELCQFFFFHAGYYTAMED